MQIQSLRFSPLLHTALFKLNRISQIDPLLLSIAHLSSRCFDPDFALFSSQYPSPYEQAAPLTPEFRFPFIPQWSLSLKAHFAYA